MVKFGLVCYQEGLNYPMIKKIATESEQVGVDSLWIHDHFLSHGTCFPMTPILETWTLLSALSTETSKLKLGTLVLCNSYRAPSLLAKMAATLDVISDGRLELGLGAGWQKSEHLAYGFPFPKGSVRVRQLDESLQIIKKMWTEKKTNFEGRYYSIKNAACEPKPVQKPYPPIWVGGTGNLLLNVVAKHADGCNFCDLSPEQYTERLHVLEGCCDRLGRDFDSINKSLFTSLVFGKYKRQLTKQLFREFTSPEKFKRAVRHPKAALSVIASRVNPRPSSIILGTPDECVEKIWKYVDLGVTYFMFKFPFIKNFKNLEMFAEKIIPEFK